MKDKRDYIKLINTSITGIFREALKISLFKPSLAYYIFRAIHWQKKAVRVRTSWKKKGVHVPAFMIASITKRCNLKCKGCYARLNHHNGNPEMTVERWKEVLGEARTLGISIVLMAGGEPFVRQDILEQTRHFPEIIFPVFTNGLMLNEEIICNLKKLKNIIPVLSVEGYADETDERRGQGVYENVQNAMANLQSKGMFFGVSLTVTRTNFNVITTGQFIQGLIEQGVRVFFFVEYIPVENGTESIVPTNEQREKLEILLTQFRTRYKSLFIAFPGDEEAFGGCLAAGRGFVHIGPDGSIEPCPFAPYSDANLREVTLREALRSEFLQKIRANAQHLSENQGCALWNNRDWVTKLLNS